jgi:hypothetical protein
MAPANVASATADVARVSPICALCASFSLGSRPILLYSVRNTMLCAVAVGHSHQMLLAGRRPELWCM